MSNTFGSPYDDVPPTGDARTALAVDDPRDHHWFKEPTKEVGPKFVGGLVFAQLVFFIALLGPATIGIGLKVQSVVPLAEQTSAIGIIAGFGAAYDAVPADSLLLQRGAGVLSPAQEAWALGGLMATYVGGLSLVPLPPLPGGTALFALAPRSVGWQKARYQLVERNIGTAVLLALLLIPLGGPQALLPSVLDSVLGPLVRAVSGV